MRFGRPMRALMRGEVVWRSGMIGTAGASRHEVDVKRTGDGDAIIFGTSHGASHREPMEFECRDAEQLGQALLDGARRCR